MNTNNKVPEPSITEILVETSSLLAEGKPIGVNEVIEHLCLYCENFDDFLDYEHVKGAMEGLVTGFLNSTSVNPVEATK